MNSSRFLLQGENEITYNQVVNPLTQLPGWPWHCILDSLRASSAGVFCGNLLGENSDRIWMESIAAHVVQPPKPNGVYQAPT